MPHPVPPVQIRRRLAVLKRQGVPFEKAWPNALEWTKWPHDKQHRHEWQEVVPSLRWAFELAYHDRDVPGGRALTALAEILTRDATSDAEIKPVRTPPPVFDSKNPGTAAGVSFIPGRDAA